MCITGVIVIGFLCVLTAVQLIFLIKTKDDPYYINAMSGVSNGTMGKRRKEAS